MYYDVYLRLKNPLEMKDFIAHFDLYPAVSRGNFLNAEYDIG